MTEERAKRKLSAILSADVKGYSRLMEEDETSTVQTLKAYRKLLTSLIQDYRGRVVDSPGDNVLAEFESAVDAVQCAVDIQKKLKTQNESLPKDKRLEFRIGINIGDVVQDGDRIYGDGVNIAARIESLADPGGICVSRNAYDHIKKKLNLGYEYLGEHAVKNISEPIRVYRVLLAPEDAGKLIGEKKSPLTKKWPGLAVATVAILIGVLVWQFYQEKLPPIEAASVENMAFPLPDEPSITVMSFENLSGDPAQEYFSDGLTNSIITQLYKIPNMFVIHRTSSSIYKDKEVKVQQVAEGMGVRYVLEGSVQKAGNRIRLNVQLIDAVKGKQLWAESYDREFKDVFDVQDEITRKIVTEMAVKISWGEQARGWTRITESHEALDLYYEADKFFMRFEKESNVRARELLTKAVELDPKFARAIAFLGWTHLIDSMFAWVKDPAKSFKEAEELGNRALAIDDTVYLTHGLLSRIYTLKRQYEKAIAAGKRAVDVEPNNATGISVLAHTMIYDGRPEEGLVLIRKAMRLSPYPPPYFLETAGYANYLTGRFEAAIAEFKKFLERQEHGAMARILWQWLIASYMELGLEEEARVEARKLLEQHPDFSIKAYIKAIKRMPYKDLSFLDRQIELLRKAGLPDKPPLPLPEKPSIAVLPFDNLSDDPEQGYFSDGMTEDIITDLSKIKDLLVISRNSTFTYKGQNKKIPEIAKELNVRYVLEGSVRRAGDQVRITAQLIDAKTDHHVWGERFDDTDTFQNIFELQDKITKKIVSALAVKLSIAEENNVSVKETTNMIAYDAYLKGKDHFNKVTPDDFIKAIDYFEQAIKIDPNYSRAYAALGQTYQTATNLGFPHKMNIDWETARLRAVHYLKLAMNNPTFEAYRLAADMERILRHYDQMVAYVEKAVSIAPNDANVNLGLGWILVFAGRPKEGIEYLNKALQLDPNNLLILANATSWIGIAHFSMGELEEAVKFIKKGSTINPESNTYLSCLVASYALLGQNIEAKKALDKYLKHFPEGYYPSIQTLYYGWSFKNVEVFDRFAEGLVKAGLRGDPSDYYKVVVENKLTGREIREILFGHTQTAIEPWGEWWVETDKEGDMIWKGIGTNQEWEEQDKGKCWIEGDMICFHFEKFFDGHTCCEEYYRNPDGNAETKSEYLGVSYYQMYPFSVVD